MDKFIRDRLRVDDGEINRTALWTTVIGVSYTQRVRMAG